MTDRERALLRLPRGTEGFYLEEALRHRRITSRIEDLFYHWGYLPVQTPVFDFYDVYEPLLGAEHATAVYRMIDRDGDLLMLRSDVTLFLAKQLGTMLTASDLPVRVYYGDTILRYQDPEDISKNEFFQSGIELIGVDGLEGEIEVLSLLARLLESIGAPPYVLHVGSRALLAALLGVPPDGVPRHLQEAVRMRDPEMLADAAAEFGLSAEGLAVTGDLAQFIGTPAEARGLLDGLRRSQSMPAEAVTELERLIDLTENLEDTGLGERLRVDASEIGTQPYHTGVAFQVYMDGFDSAVCAGGRYDGLLRSFGFDASSVGFSLMQRKLEPYLPLESDRPAAADGPSAAGPSAAADRPAATGSPSERENRQ